MQPALGFFFTLPTSGTAFLFYCTVYTTNRLIAFGNERMERQVVAGDIVVALFFADVEHRIKFDDATVFFKDIQRGTMI